RHFHQLRQPPRFCLRRRGSFGRNPVVATPLVVVGRRGAVARFDDEPLFEHSLDGAIERPGAELELAARAHRNFLDDRVAVTILVGESEKDMEGGGRQHGADYIRGGYIHKGYRRRATLLGSHAARLDITWIMNEHSFSH